MIMESGNFLRKGLIISLALHAVILLQRPSVTYFRDRNEKELKLSYVRLPKEDKYRENKPVFGKEPFMDTSQKIAMVKAIPQASPGGLSGNNSIFGSGKSSLSLPTVAKPVSLIKPEIVSTKRKISLPQMEAIKISNPSYISYYQIVREKIKRAAYQNYGSFETGEVTVSFVLAADGTLLNLALKEDKSSSSTYLRNNALRSVKDASPFPSFPPGLDYPQLPFNLTIVFEIE